MDDTELLHRIQTLVDEEHELMQRHQATADLTAEQHAHMKAVEVQLDQLWDLLRQRRARRHAGLNPDEAQARPVDVVEHYQQ